MNAFDAILQALLWQVLGVPKVSGMVLTVTRFKYAQDSAAVRTSAGLPECRKCLLEVKQACPFSPTLSNLYDDGLEKHVLQTAGFYASESIGELVLLSLCADDFPPVSSSQLPGGLQQQFDALADFCAGRQLEVVHSESVWKQMLSVCSISLPRQGGKRSTDIWSSCLTIMRKVAYGANHLFAATRKAVYAMRRATSFGACQTLSMFAHCSTRWTFPS